MEVIDHSYIEKNLARNDVQISNVIRELVYSKNSDLFDRLDFNNDAIFLEPLLFSYFNYRGANNFELGQILWGYVDNYSKPRLITVVSNQDGVIYLPNYGYLITDQKSSLFELRWEQGQLELLCNGLVVKYKREDLSYILGFEVLIHEIPLLVNLFSSHDDDLISQSVTTLNNDTNLSSLRIALQKIEEYNNKYFSYLRRTVKKFHLYRGKPNSFATMKAHGIAFFNVQPNDGVIFFLDNIVHQCGHVIFNSITFQKDRLFKVSADTPLSYFTGDQNDSHDIYGRFHGLFTQANTNTTFDNCIDRNAFEKDELMELVGRFCSNMNRFKIALIKLNHPNMYTSLGTKWYNYFAETYDSLYNKRKSLISEYIVSNQPYVFNFKLFKEINSVNDIV